MACDVSPVVMISSTLQTVLLRKCRCRHVTIIQYIDICLIRIPFESKIAHKYLVNPIFGNYSTRCDISLKIWERGKKCIWSKLILIPSTHAVHYLPSLSIQNTLLILFLKLFLVSVLVFKYISYLSG